MGSRTQPGEPRVARGCAPQPDRRRREPHLDRCRLLCLVGWTPRHGTPRVGRAAYHGGVSSPRGRGADIGPGAARDGDDPAGARNPWRRVARRVAYENPWLTVWHDDVIRPDGAPGIYGIVHFVN